jgi:hypothetical protein
MHLPRSDPLKTRDAATVWACGWTFRVATRDFVTLVDNLGGPHRPHDVTKPSFSGDSRAAREKQLAARDGGGHVSESS